VIADRGDSAHELRGARETVERLAVDVCDRVGVDCELGVAVDRPPLAEIPARVLAPPIDAFRLEPPFHVNSERILRGEERQERVELRRSAD
jgi:hypothetical protein